MEYHLIGLYGFALGPLCLFVSLLVSTFWPIKEKTSQPLERKKTMQKTEKYTLSNDDILEAIVDFMAKNGVAVRTEDVSINIPASHPNDRDRRQVSATVVKV